MKQREVFLASEGNAYLARNRPLQAAMRWPEDDPVLAALLPVLDAADPPLTRILEIGCSEAIRLGWLMRHRDVSCSGVEPSGDAVTLARARGVDARLGTANDLPFDDATFDVVIFGFCLYVCDRDDLSRIAEEANRVLRAPGWILIHDFFSESPLSNDYGPAAGLTSYKMDYRTLFAAFPDYVAVSHTIISEDGAPLREDGWNRAAISLLRKGADNSSAG